MRGRLNLPGVTYMGFMQGGWNSLLTLPSSVFLAQREKQKALISLKEFFRAGMFSNFSEERVHVLHILLPARAVVPMDCSS